MRYTHLDGAIEGLEINGMPIGLWNFKSQTNLENKGAMVRWVFQSRPSLVLYSFVLKIIFGKVDFVSLLRTFSSAGSSTEPRTYRIKSPPTRAYSYYARSCPEADPFNATFISLRPVKSDI